ncbi:hypothetical protein P7K49_019329 [Saguinus oedipus]|uniref:Uncharacterized protein n=1 Tax=Saguinus oedipus TaxID=9490 RepID=A0ABQ9UYV9_SAGOE|nr:hypothetical protein P7K49_019329 [Saguinus oedipus]
MAMAGCVSPGRYFSRGGLCLDAPPSPGCTDLDASSKTAAPSASNRCPACPRQGGTRRARSTSSLPQSPSSPSLSSSPQAERLTLSLAPQSPADRALGSVRSPVPLPTAHAQITLPRKLLVWLIVQVLFNQMDMPICPSKSQIACLTGHPDQ